MKSIVVVNNPKDWNFDIEGIEVVEAKSYLTNIDFAEKKNVRIFNLCRSYKYQSTGYYVSLLAEARGHRSFPNVATMQDLKSLTIIRSISDDIDELIQKSLKKLKSKDFALSIYFGKNLSTQYEQLSKQLYNLFQAPLLRAHFIFQKKWIIQNISPVPVNEIPESHKFFVEEFARKYFSKKRHFSAKIYKYSYDLAILVNPDDEEPPSNKKAVKKFIEAADKLNIRTDLITKDDYNHILEYDALFIRETTAVNNHTYRFSRRAFTEGLVVIDDPVSILKCTNKVYLTELLIKNKIPTPKTLIIHKENKNHYLNTLEFPVVLKQPDSSFSQGVVKVENKDQFKKEITKLFESSDLVIAQKFTYSEFDWRIGILDKKSLFACKYFMAKDHWQIYDWTKTSSSIYGNFEAVKIEDVPKEVLNNALKAANLIGNGLYGVDLKFINNKVYVIEINDNPSIEAGIEDKILGDDLYLRIMQSFKSRIERSRELEELSL